jgi:uncharacterized protein
MSTFLYKLLPSRPTFAADMSDSERSAMRQQRGTAIVFGPVNDPAGSWGLAIVKADSEADVTALGQTDPAITAGVARFEVCAMPGAVIPA